VTQHNRLQSVPCQVDIVIVGGGIYGATLCWEAAHRGLKVVLVEQCDFASGTSSNSLKTIHGGLRAIQRLDFSACREAASERRTFLKIAPHLVKPLRCLLPTSNQLMKNRWVVGAGAALYNLLTRDRNLGLASEQSIPAAGLISLAALKQHTPTLKSEPYSGALSWHDAQAGSTERLVLAFVQSAIRQGGHALNYVAAHKLLYKGGIVQGVCIQDELNGERRNIESAIVIDASSGWQFYKQQGFSTADRSKEYVQAVNVVVDRTIAPVAMGVQTHNDQYKGRALFIAPWQNRSIIGTWYATHHGPPNNSLISQKQVEEYLNGVNSAFDQLDLRLDEICNVHVGYLPADKALDFTQDTESSLLRHNHLHRCNELVGLYVQIGTKFTMARASAASTIDTISAQHGLSIKPSRSQDTNLHGGELESTLTLQAKLSNQYGDKVPNNTMNLLIEHFGSCTTTLLASLEENPSGANAIPGAAPLICQVIDYCVEHEQVHSLEDLLKRRLNLGSIALPPKTTIDYCSHALAARLGWSHQVRQNQINQLYTSYPNWMHQKTDNTATPIEELTTWT